MRMRFELAAAAAANGTPHMEAAEELAMQISGPARSCARSWPG